MRRVVWGVLGGLLLSVTSQPQALTLSEYVADVVKAHPTILQQLHYYRQVVQDLQIAGKGWRPTVDLSLSSGRYSTKSPTTSQQRLSYNSSLAGITVTQNLFNGYDTTYQQSQNQARLLSAMYELYDTADNIALEAIKSYLNVLKQQKLVTLAEQSVESHNRIMSHIHEQSMSGVGRRSDVEQTEARLAMAHASLVAQQNNYQDAMTQLHKMLGRYEEGHELEVPAALLPPTVELDTFIDEALTKHPAILSAQYNEEASQYEYLRSKSSDYPTIDLQLQQQLGRDLDGYEGNTDELSLVLNLSYRIYDGGAQRATQQKMISQTYENREFTHLNRRQVIDGLRLAWIGDQGLKRQLHYLRNHVTKARQTAESYREEFYVGQRDLLDLLDSENELNSALKRQTEAFYDSLTTGYRIFEGAGQLFKPLDLDFEILGNDIFITTLRANELDELPMRNDEDDDNEINQLDHCDNTISGDSVNQFGCNTALAINLGYKVPDPPQIEKVNFIFDKTELTDESKVKFDRIIEKLKAYPKAEIEFYAYADNLGTDQYNELLAERRAQAMLVMLIERGIDGRRIKAIGMGERESFADVLPGIGNNEDRRGEFKIILY